MIIKHAFRNALIPVVSVVAIDIGGLFGGLIITEQIFSIPGMGRVFIDALTAGDAQVLVVWMLVTAAFVVLFNLIADIAYGFLDPRVRLDMSIDSDSFGTERPSRACPPTEGERAHELMGMSATATPVPRSGLRARAPASWSWRPGVEPVARTPVAAVPAAVPAPPHGHLLAGACSILLFVLCFGARWIAPYPKNDQNLLLVDQPPSAQHCMGTDDLGRDELTEVLYAGQISLRIGLTVGILSTLIGTAAGAIAGFFGKWQDQFLMRLTDLFLIVPALVILAIAIKKFGRHAMGHLLGAGRRVLDVHGPGRARPGAVAAREGVRGGGAGLGGVELAHHRAPHPAQHHRPDHGHRHPGRGRPPSSPSRRCRSSASACSRRPRRGATC